MERRIDPDTPLDYVELQIFPSHNRYEACVSTSNIAEKVASGDLQELLTHLPQVKDLLSKSSNSNFKILAPEDFNDNSWFTTTTLNRFLQIVGSPDILTIGNEISQLKETRKFQVSLFSKTDVDMTSSFESKNELLRTVDLRLSELKENLSNSLNQAASAICSPKEISNIENLAHHFGADNIRDSLQKLLDFNQSKDTTTERITNIPTSQLSPPVKYGVSPAKAAQMERQLSTDSDTSSFSSEDNDNDNQPPPIERSRTPVRSSASRRSASPMRRIQIGRGGPRRPAVLSIKSLNYVKSTSQRDEAGQSSQDEDDETERLAKNNALRMSVQDKISLFESKKKEEQNVEIQKPKIVQKAVLRRWSSGMSESHETSEIIPKDAVEKTKSPSPEKNADVAIDNEEKSNEKDISTWSEQKEAELNQLFTKMMESKPARRHSVTNDNSKSKNKSSEKEQRGGFYDHYKQKRDEKLRKEVGKRAEKEAQFKEMEQFLDDKKAEIVSTKNKPVKNPSQLSNPKKETVKAPVKKITNKPSQLPVTRKSWPSAPSPKPTVTPPRTLKPQSVTPPVRPNPNPITKAEKSTPKTKTLKVTQPDVKKITKTVEKKQPATVKSTPVVKPKTRTKVETPVTSTTTTTATATAAKATATKPSFYKKVTKKSSVVPMETKPFLRKGTGIGPGGGSVVVKSKVVAQIEEPVVTEDPIELEKIKKIEKIQVVEIETTKCEPPECDNDAKLDSGIISKELETCDSFDVSGDGGVKKIEMVDNDNNDNGVEVEVEEELMISPTAWVEIEEDNREDEIVACDERPVVQVAGGANVGVTSGVSSPRVRHSLFQMLLEETGEGESGEWGNAQHPPVQKDAPKGFKRLLKFARKSKADLLLTDGSSPSSIFRRG